MDIVGPQLCGHRVVVEGVRHDGGVRLHTDNVTGLVIRILLLMIIITQLIIMLMNNDNNANSYYY